MCKSVSVRASCSHVDGGENLGADSGIGGEIRAPNLCSELQLSFIRILD